MNPNAQHQWLEANRQCLMAALRAVQQELEAYGQRSAPAPTAAEPKALWQRLLGKLGLRQEQQQPLPVPAAQPLADAKEIWRQAANDLPYSPALDTLAATFGLSDFERKVLLLCAGMELDAKFSAVVGGLNGGSNGSAQRPTFSLALAAFSEAHWNAISPQSPLRYWNLVLLQSADLITRSPLKIDEYVLHYLTGTRYLDEKMSEMLDRAQADYPLAPSQEALAMSIAQALRLSSGNGGGKAASLPFVQLNGDERSDQLAVAALAAEALGCQLYRLSALSLPADPREAAGLLRWWNRESALHPSALYLDCSKADAHDRLRWQSILSAIENVQSILIIGGAAAEASAGTKRARLSFEVPKPSHEEQLGLWSAALGTGLAAESGEALQLVVAQFNLSAKSIAAIALEAKPRLLLAALEANERTSPSPVPGAHLLWDACRSQTRPKIDELAQRIVSTTNWKDIVLPEEQLRSLREIADQLKNRKKVYQDFGMEGTGTRGLGISALFAGESGTGKTMASEVLANDLQLDLYRIDLSQVVNKYIGETEKNLKRIFDAAEEGGSILLFDEADALFGKRSEVKDSHDRYSNIEVSYLLQRMESYRGLAILTTNMRNALDTAFLRRIRFAIQFPYPGAGHRREIWQRAFPDEVPKEEIDFERLSCLSLPGGNIRNVALNAAFLAAEEGCPLRMSHLFHAARSEYRKLEKTFSNSEIKAMQ